MLDGKERQLLEPRRSAVEHLELDNLAEATNCLIRAGNLHPERLRSSICSPR